MIEQAITKIEKLTKDGLTAVVVEGLNPRNAAFVDLHNGSLTKVEDDAPAREHSFETLECFCEFLNAGPEAEGGEIGKAWPKATLWHLGDDVVAVLIDVSDGARDDRATVSLRQSEIFKSAMEDAKAWHDQRTFVKFLLKNLRDQIDAAEPGLIDKLRNLTWNSGNTASGQVTKSRESIDQSIVAALNEAESLPEIMIVRLPRWAGVDCVVEVKLFLECDLEQRKFRLEPLADQCVLAERAAHDWLENRLSSETSLPVYYGQP